MASKYLLSAFVGMVLFAACKKEEVPEPDLGYGYFPTKLGTWVEYQVDSLWRDDPVNVRDSVSYRLREKIVQHYNDLEGRPCQMIHRSVQNAEGEWVIRDVWSSTVDAYRAEKAEENYRKLKLSFPVRNARRWDMNALGTSAVNNPEESDELMVGYEEVDQPWNNAYLSFGKTVLVKNTVPANFIETRNFEERYADGVGLVEKYWEESANRVTTNPDGSYVLRYVGWRLRMTAVAYGVD